MKCFKVILTACVKHVVFVLVTVYTADGEVNDRSRFLLKKYFGDSRSFTIEAFTKYTNSNCKLCI